MGGGGGGGGGRAMKKKNIFTQEKNCRTNKGNVNPKKQLQQQHAG